MNTLVLKRLETSNQGTFGVLEISTDNNVFFMYTLELPWVNNLPNISCIPTGKYRGMWEISPRFKRFMYGLKNVPGRAGVRIHSANLASQLNGCIALGLKLGQIEGKKAILLSSTAVRQFEKLMNKQEFELEIKE